jgi:hypothetical protein
VTTTGVVNAITPVSLPLFPHTLGFPAAPSVLTDRSSAVFVMNALIVPALTGTSRKPESQLVPSPKFVKLLDAS